MLNNLTHEEELISAPGTLLEKAADFTSPLWTVEDVADYLKLQPETIRSMARRGELPAIKFGKVWRFQKTAILKMLVELRNDDPEFHLRLADR